MYKFLGLSVGLIQAGMESAERREAYACDVVYVTNQELGFDFLRDNLAMSQAEVVSRELNFCVVDEGDSVLIDEARRIAVIATHRRLYQAERSRRGHRLRREVDRQRRWRWRCLCR